MDPLIEAEELAPILGIGVPDVWKLAREGKIPAHKVGRRWRFQLQAVLDHTSTRGNGQTHEHQASSPPRSRG
ncbi:MAG: helix-turn-helix domain-containing protein [Actinobacteria bacterium]|nr:helix-turn-helix domain-containing protein [Actinomycetota bacterium]MBU1942898.1 helix-turn-helix domain-containing protein [Actinomycetota bacterium]MBU2687630.1 helix-turn-helix domain-containing protein [Actinomycetota bacterium]